MNPSQKKCLPASSAASSNAPLRSAINALPRAVLLAFGIDGCGFYLASAPIVTTALAAHPAFKHLKVEDGPGQALGRSFQVKQWPTQLKGRFSM
jgi:thioredoxin 1